MGQEYGESFRKTCMNIKRLLQLYKQTHLNLSGEMERELNRFTDFLTSKKPNYGCTECKSEFISVRGLTNHIFKFHSYTFRKETWLDSRDKTKYNDKYGAFRSSKEV